MTGQTAVTVIIPHLRNRPLLEACLNSLRESSFPDFTIIVVDNGGHASDLEGLEASFPEVRVCRLPENVGYAGACNRGLRLARTPWVVFLNDDTVVDPHWLGPLVAAARRDPHVGALQPKILSLRAKREGVRVFDYAGAGGGMLDRLGYPWCIGRNLYGVEEDRGQHDLPRPIFWASGAAMFAWREAVERVGGFDESYFMHMEEIDLCWRMQLAGYTVRSVPASVVWHEGGASLRQGSPQKVLYNHRNNIAMLATNLGCAGLVALLPARMALECAAALFYLKDGREGLGRALQVFRAAAGNIANLGAILRKRSAVQRHRLVSDRELFRGAPLSSFLPPLFRNRP